MFYLIAFVVALSIYYLITLLVAINVIIFYPEVPDIQKAIMLTGSSTGFMTTIFVIISIIVNNYFF